jgi:hypothetical protein
MLRYDHVAEFLDQLDQRIWLQAYNGQFGGAEADITDLGAPHSQAPQLSGSGSAPSNMDNTVALFSQFMASAFGHLDFGTSPTSVTGANEAFQGLSPSLTSPSPDSSHHT